MAEGQRETVRVRLRDIHYNPYRDRILNPIREDSVAQATSDIQRNGLRIKFLCRRKGGKLQLAFGHHRLEAVKRLLGEDHVLEVDVEDLSDRQMIEQMAGDNNPAYNCTMREIDNEVKAARDYLEKHPEERKGVLTSGGEEDKHERIKAGAPMYAKMTGKKVSSVRMSLERLNAVKHGVVDPNALYLMPSEHTADIFIEILRRNSKLDKKYHVPLAKIVNTRKAYNESDMEMCIYMGGLNFFSEQTVDLDYGWDTRFKSLAGRMSQLGHLLLYMPTSILGYFDGEGRSITDVVRVRDLNNFHNALIRLRYRLMDFHRFIDSKVPSDVWVREEVEPTVEEYKALLARTERQQGKDIVLHPGELRKVFGLHKRKEVPWGRYHLWEVKKMIKEGKFYYVEKKAVKKKNEKPRPDEIKKLDEESRVNEEFLPFSRKDETELRSMTWEEAALLADKRADEVMTPELGEKDGKAYFKVGKETYRGVIDEWLYFHEGEKKRSKIRKREK